MTKTETGKILASMYAIYPTMRHDIAPGQASGQIDVWHHFFADIPYEHVSAALDVLVSSSESKYPPSIGSIKKKVNELFPPVEAPLSTEAAWILVHDAARNGKYGSKKEFSKLPPLVQKAVVSPKTLEEWAIIQEDEMATVVASFFKKRYAVMLEREIELQAAPADIRVFISDRNATLLSDSQHRLLGR